MTQNHPLLADANVPARFDARSAGANRHADLFPLLVPAMNRVDPLADAAADSLVGLPGGFGLLERGISQGEGAVTDAPAALRAFVAATEPVPDWVDWEAVQRGGDAFLRTGLPGGMVLGMKSLVLGYASPGGNKPLVFSGRLHEQAARRLSETSRFVQAVSRPGGMRRGGEGLAITLKVRVMHAQVRRLIGASGRWRPELWGAPINQHDMLATVLLFSVALVDGLRRLGYAFSERDGEDLVHLWRLVGHYMGVEADLLPRSYAQAWDLAEAIRDTQGAPDDDARALVAALFAARASGAATAREKWLAKRRVAVMHGVCRLLIGDELADQLAIPRGAWDPARTVLRGAVGLVSRANRLPLMRDVAVKLGDKYWDAAVAEGLGGAAASYAPPGELRGRIKRTA